MIGLLIIFSNSIYSQQTLSCSGIETPTSNGAPSSVLCTPTSSSWLNKYKKVLTYLPHDNSPSKKIGINLIIFQDDLGVNNFQNNSVDNQRLNYFFSSMLNVYQHNGQPSDPISGVTELTKKYVEFDLKGIYFYRNTTLNTSTYGPAMISYLRQNDPARLQFLNVFITNGNGYAQATRGATYDLNLDLYANLSGMYSNLPSSDYAAATLMAHEMCHTLDLCHTYICPYCGCYSTLSGMGTNPEDGDYFDDVFGLPYPGNAPHYKPNDPPINPPWDYDVTLSSTDRITNNLLGGFRAEYYLSPLQIAKMHRALALKTVRRYLIDCVYDVNNPWNISSNEDWDFDILWDKDINVQSGATVNLSCKLSMPQTSSITVESGGILNIDGIVTNNCDNGWNGTIHVKAGGVLNLKANANITFIGNGKILIDDDITNPGLLTIDGIPKVYLKGYNTMIDIRGKVDIKNNSTFSFFYQGSSTPHGFIKFANTSLNPSRNITAGNNSNINLTGSAPFKKILEIDQETFYAPPGIVNFTISRGKVELASNARLQADGLSTNINLFDAIFTSTTPGVNNGHRGVHLYGQPNVSINNCVFEYGSTGIYAFLTYGGAPLNIYNSTFRNNTYGVSAYDKGCNLYNCNFFDNEFGFFSSYMSFPSFCSGSMFNRNVLGAYWHSYSNASLTIDNATIQQNDTGVKAHAAPLTVTCSNISYNDIGLEINYGATLMMQNQTKVIAIGNNYTIKPLEANYLNLDYGYNDLTPSGLHNQSAINGTMLSGISLPIPARYNKWNSAGTFSTSDYNLHDINGNNLTIDGSNPLSSALACGIDPCPIPPCGDPCPKPPCDIIVQDALIYCPDCGTINTADFTNKKLNEATMIALDKVKSKDAQNYRKGLKLFSQILNVNFPNPNKRESYLLNLNYLKLQETLGNAFLSKQINNSNVLAVEVQNIIDIENNYIDKANQQKNYYRKFLYTMDKAQTYRIANRRDLSLNLLDNILTWVETDDIEEVNNFICTINIENDALEGSIDLGTIAEIMNKCNHINKFRLTAPAKNVPLSNNEPETMISISPNPINNIANIRTNIENARIILFDNVGQSIADKKINYDTDIDLSSVAGGIYIIKIENLETSEHWIKKLVVQ